MQQDLPLHSSDLFHYFACKVCWVSLYAFKPPSAALASFLHSALAVVLNLGFLSSIHLAFHSFWFLTSTLFLISSLITQYVLISLKLISGRYTLWQITFFLLVPSFVPYLLFKKLDVCFIAPNIFNIWKLVQTHSLHDLINLLNSLLGRSPFPSHHNSFDFLHFFSTSFPHICFRTSNN